MVRSKQTKVSPEFDKEIGEILNQKRVNGTLKNIPEINIGRPLLTKKILKSQYWKKMEEELIQNVFEPE